MAALQPPNFVDVTTALSSQGRMNVIGVAVDVLPSCKTSGSSAVVTFTIRDSDFGSNSWDGLKVKYFNNEMSLLPAIQVGDAIVLHDIWVKFFGGRKIGVAAQYETVAWAIFRDKLDSSPICGPVPWEPTLPERRYAKALLEYASRDSDFSMLVGRKQEEHQEQVRQAQKQVPSAAPISRNHTTTTVSSNRSRSGPSFSLIKDIVPGTIVVLMGEIVKLHTNDSEKCIIYITDYTSNKALTDYGENDDGSRLGDEFGYIGRSRKKWAGPKGQATLQVTLWDPHAAFARDCLKEGDLVLLTYVRIKTGRFEQKVEASVHTDKMWPNKIHVHIVNAEDDDRARDLLQRRREYEKKEQANQEPGDEPNGAGGSKKKKKKNLKQQKKQEAKREEGQKPLMLSSVLLQQRHPNHYITSWRPGVPALSLEDILSNKTHNNISPDGVEYRLPFQNICYRSLVRVVDFFPPHIEDFSVPTNPYYEALSNFGGEVDKSHHHVHWEWRFCLLVESSNPTPQGQTRERVKLFVSGDRAVHLLKIDATDLRRDPSQLHSLREKLFILWGNLEEKKRESESQAQCSLDQDNGNENGNGNSSSISSHPFTCCIEEYGVRCRHRQQQEEEEKGEKDDNSDGDDNYDDDAGGKDNTTTKREPGCTHPDCFGWERRFAMFGTSIMV